MDKIKPTHDLAKQKYFSADRINAFSDGVFAIAITLLVLVIHVPTPQEIGAHSLWTALFHQWPNYLGFLLSFITIGIVWINHHTMFSYIKRIDHVLLLLNLLLLMDVVFIPYPTYLIALYVGSSLNQSTAIAMYSGTFAIGGIFFNLIWWYASKKNLIFKEDIHSLQKLGKSYLIGPILYGVGFLLSFVFDGILGLLLCIFLALFYLLPLVNLL